MTVHQCRQRVDECVVGHVLGIGVGERGVAANLAVGRLPVQRIQHAVGCAVTRADRRDQDLIDRRAVRFRYI